MSMENKNYGKLNLPNQNKLLFEVKEKKVPFLWQEIQIMQWERDASQDLQHASCLNKINTYAEPSEPQDGNLDLR